MTQRHTNTLNLRNKNYLMLCELHNVYIHGKTKDSDPNIETHYIVYDKFDGSSGISIDCLEDIDTNYDIETDEDMMVVRVEEVTEFLKGRYANSFLLHSAHVSANPTIRNYHHIIRRPDYIKPEIGEYILLPTLEAVAILKTFWLRLIQRKWKKVFKERQAIWKQRYSPSALMNREVTGKWPPNCSYLPGVRGMLKELTNSL